MWQVVLNDETLDIVLDFAPGRNLAYYVDEFGALSERHARHFFQQIVIAVDFCHKRETCVRGIRLDNLALNAELDIVKLIHFDLSKVIAVLCAECAECVFLAESNGAVKAAHAFAGSCRLRRT